jgi:hypothetical protein
MASASLIQERPEDTLVRPVESFDRTPSFGPKFHLTRAQELIVYPRERYSDESDVACFSIMTLCMALGVGLVAIIPRCQRILILFRLLD